MKPIKVAAMLAAIILSITLVYMVITGLRLDYQVIAYPTHSFAVDQTDICITPCSYKGTSFTVVEIIDDGSDITVLIGKDAYPALSGDQAIEIAKAIIDGGRR